MDGYIVTPAVQACLVEQRVICLVETLKPVRVGYIHPATLGTRPCRSVPPCGCRVFAYNETVTRKLLRADWIGQSARGNY